MATREAPEGQRVGAGKARRASTGSRGKVKGAANPKRKARKARVSSARGGGSSVGTADTDKEADEQRESLLAAAVARKTSESNLALLENRVKHLNAEYAKARARIDETWNRVKEVRDLRARDEAKAKRKAEAMERRRAKEEKARRRLAEKQEEQRKLKAEQESAKRKAAADKARQVKRELEEGLRWQAEEAAAEKERRAKLHDSIRHSHTKLSKARLNEEAMRRKQAQDEYLRRKREEEERAAKARATVAKLESVEAELIAQLKAQQEEQLKVFQELESNIVATELPTK